jgi:excisionase family DNA binding protein
MQPDHGPQSPDYETPTAAAERVGVTRAYVVRLANRGDIPGAVRVGVHWMIPRNWQYTPSTRALRPAE